MEDSTRAQTSGARSMSTTDTQTALFSDEALLKLLAAMRGSSVPENTRGEIRDLVLTYAQTDAPDEKAQASAQLVGVLSPYVDEFAPLFNDQALTAMRQRQRQQTQAAAQADTPSVQPQQTTARQDAGSTIGRKRPRPQFGQAEGTSEIRNPKSETPKPPESKTVKNSKPSNSVPDDPDNQQADNEVSGIDESHGESASNKVGEIRNEKIETETETQSKTQTSEQATPSTPTDEQSAAPQPSAPASATDPNARITEIKRAINERVGNPVNLIEQNKEVGREYMAALLAAMKAVGGAGGTAAAMERLETAFAAANRVLDNAEASASDESGDTANASEPTKPPESKPAKNPKHLSRRQADEIRNSKFPNSVSDDPDSQRADNEAGEVRNENVETETEVQPEQSRTAEAPRDTQPAQQDASNAAADVSDQTDEPPQQHETAKAAENRWEATTTPHEAPSEERSDESEQPAVAPHREEQKEENSSVHRVSIRNTTRSAPTTKLSSIDEVTDQNRTATTDSEQPAETPADAVARKPRTDAPATPTPESAAAYASAEKADAPAAPKDELHTETIDAALEQLLSEWRIFKKSGFLGTGPNGSEHPLYKKLQNLPMAAVVAGRFEGATKEIRQNISDYMNGWRYEHNIVHKMDEPFEHYLRRVIKHILKQNNDTE